MDLMLQDNIVSEGITNIVRAVAAAEAVVAAAAVMRIVIEWVVKIIISYARYIVA